MFSAELYNAIYNYSMLAVVLVTFLIYFQSGSEAGLINTSGYNKLAAWILAIGMIVFIGTRPISGIFVDMGNYAKNYNFVQINGASTYADWLFNYLVEIMAPYFSVNVFFIVCTTLYIIPLTLAAYNRHGNLAFPVLLSLMTSFSFFSYGTNGLRNGIATSLLIAAFSWSNRFIVMLALMLAAIGMHGSALIPIVFFLITLVWSRTWSYGLAWAFTLAFVTITGSRTSEIIMQFLPSGGDDNRLESYIGGIGNDRGGYRLDFILYSIVPIIVSYIFAKKEMRSDQFYKRLLCTYLATNSFWLLVMYAAFSNRFAYLSWFLMPWVIIYPLLPRQTKTNAKDDALRYIILACAICAHFAFTFLMLMYVYANRIA
jgi:hypothetical protein